MQKKLNEESPEESISCLKLFKGRKLDITLPINFNYPFSYEPHPLAIQAAEELMDYIYNHLVAYHDFGLNDSINGLGKMFGVLVVEDGDGNTGYLSAFSGKLDRGLHIPGFVPPVFDTVEEQGFYRQGEKDINKISRKIEKLEAETAYKNLCDLLEKYKAVSEKEINTLKSEFVHSRNERHQLRIYYHQNDQSIPEEVLNKLNHESIRQHFILKDRKKFWKKTIEDIVSQLSTFNEKISELKEQRKKMSIILQHQLFQRYTFLNQNGAEKSLIEIFNINDEKIPPSGAGECAAPKLLQYAYKNKLRPLTMAEFWWGKSPVSEIRKHRHFYPACNSKCKPILGHMLEGLSVDKNPMATDPVQQIDLPIIYEDEYIIAINKPIDMLSVPGKSDRISVYDLIKQRFPKISGPIIVHRLDMSTSGIMLLAKSKSVHQHLQSQFGKHKIKKRYIAILDGLLTSDEGVIDLPLRVDMDDRPRQIICYQHGKPAVTHWKVIERKNNTTRVHFFPVTGRTHQLRVHASFNLGLNVPIKGDDLYGQRDERLFLHAEEIEFTHPATKQIVTLFAESDF